MPLDIGEEGGHRGRAHEHEPRGLYNEAYLRYADHDYCRDKSEGDMKRKPQDVVMDAEDAIVDAGEHRVAALSYGTDGLFGRNALAY